jgi:type IV pilus assembly protein PilW
VSSRTGERGFSLPELMVSLVVGLLLLAAFVAVLNRCRREFAANESAASLQDNSRHALSVLVPDLEHAGFFGFHAAPKLQLVRAGIVMAEQEMLRQPDTTHLIPPASGLPSGIHDCGVNFAVDLELGVQGANNSWPAGIDAQDCAPTGVAGSVVEGSDTLTVRHASLDVVRPLAGRLQLYSRRLDAHGRVVLFADGRAPGALDDNAAVRDVEVRSYYVASHSVGRRNWPALRVKALSEASGRAQFRDEEVLPGVEDLQVEFAVVDPRDPEGRSSFVAPDFPELRSHRVVAVRLWLRIRADRTEAGYRDPQPLRDADREFVPTDDEAKQRRVLLERTVALRNLRAP